MERSVLLVALVLIACGSFVPSLAGSSKTEAGELLQSVFELRLKFEQMQASSVKLVEPLGITAAFPRNCSEVLANGANTSGVYTIQFEDDSWPIEVYCDMETDGGGWTVFQRRQDGSVDFYRDWESYRRGFGNLNGEFWLGNDILHRLTFSGSYKLRIDLTDFDGNYAYGLYSYFYVFSSKNNFSMDTGGYSGTAGDSLTQHKFQAFSTKDRDNDYSSVHCSQKYHGAWWYTSCHGSNLNGKYRRGDIDDIANGVSWKTFKGRLYSLKTSEMKIRDYRI